MGEKLELDFNSRMYNVKLDCSSEQSIEFNFFNFN